MNEEQNKITICLHDDKTAKKISVRLGKLGLHNLKQSGIFPQSLIIKFKTT